MSEEPLDCPCCGASGGLCEEPHDVGSSAERYTYYIECQCCGLRTPEYASESCVLNIWNERPPERKIIIRHVQE